MNTQYYIIINGQQTGSMTKEALKYSGIQPSTYVWRAGLPDWVLASQLPELADLFIDDSAFETYAADNRYGQPQQPGYGQPQSGYGQSQQPYQQGSYPPPPNNGYYSYGGPSIQHFNWLGWAIAGTVLGALFSCIGMIFGIIGITQANKANRYYAEGWEEKGDVANSSARTMTIISLVIAGIGLIMLASGLSRSLLQSLLPSYM